MTDTGGVFTVFVHVANICSNDGPEISASDLLGTGQRRYDTPHRAAIRRQIDQSPEQNQDAIARTADWIDGRYLLVF